MSDIREAKSVHRQASEWLVLLESGDATPEERTRFDVWLRDHPGHRAAFEELEGTWGRLHEMGARVRARGMVAVDPEPVLEKLARPGRQRRRRPVVWTAAATVLLAVIGGIHFYPTESPTVYATDIGERSTVTLPDSSTLELNTDTELVVDYSGKSRRVILRHGETYFDVADNDSRPFVVEAGHGAIRAVGTGFLVRLKSRELVTVTVTEGIVELTRAATPESNRPTPHAVQQPPTLGKGQRAEYDRQVTRIELVPPEELARTHSWRQGMLIFDGQSLDEVISEVGRYTDARLVISDAELKDLRIGGAFRAGDIAALLEVLEKGFGITVERDGTRIIYLRSSSTAATG